MQMSRKVITTTWFFTQTHPVLKMMGIYVNGDGLILIPLLLVIIALLLLSFRLGILVLALYFTVRGLGEMVYWLLQQFGPKTHRPYDYGLLHLSNEGVYIIYQLTSMVHVIVGVTFIIYFF